MINSTEIAEEITLNLFSSELKRLDKELTYFINENWKITNNSLFNFNDVLFYSDKFYILRNKKIRTRGTTINTIHYTLVNNFLNFFNDAKQIESDFDKIKQHILLVVLSCEIPQQLRNSLPDVLMQFSSSGISNLNRTRSIDDYMSNRIGVSFQNNFKVVEQKINYYAATHLLN